jgi:hypothetical protein
MDVRAGHVIELLGGLSLMALRQRQVQGKSQSGAANLTGDLLLEFFGVPPYPFSEKHSFHRAVS